MNALKPSVITKRLRLRGVWPSQTRTITSLRIDSGSLIDDIHSTSVWGTGPRWGKRSEETGMSRLSLTDSDREARKWFQDTCTKLGCEVTTDAMGNQFAIRKHASNPDGLPTAAGSHLDTQPLGGRYDGVLGVTAGISLLRALQKHNVTTNFPIAVVNWTNEEGARFPISMVSSGVWAGAIPLKKAYDLASVVPGEERMTMRSELERIGNLGQMAADHEKGMHLAAHFELHIEQGPILERTKRQVGIVTGVQSYAWSTLHITGRATHTGTTDLASRSDALLAASKMIVRARRVAQEEGALASVGICEAKPGAVNTVPGAVKMSLDVRGKTDEIRVRAMNRLQTEFTAIANGTDTTELAGKGEEVALDWQVDSVSEAVQFHQDNISCVRSAAEDVAGKDGIMDMTSGAGHDSVYTSKVCPTSMVFVPCRNGVSHNPEEWCEPDDCSRGAQVLSDAVLRYDELRAQRAQ